MPWFHRRDEDEKQRDETARLEREQNVAALQSGGIPLAAERRLDQVAAQDHTFFTSDLSVPEFLVARQAGVTPVSQVMGSSVYHVGWQYISNWGTSGELTVVSRAHNEVRALALRRMALEAERVGAHVVMGVRLIPQTLGEANLLEFQAVGTAGRVAGAPTGPAALTNLSGQDFWKLYQAGYWPLGVASGSTVYHVVPSWGNQSAMSGWGRWQNQELTDFTNGLYLARQIAMSRVTEEARNRLGAHGVVGMVITQTEHEYEVNIGGDRTRKDLICTFNAIGTAITEIGTGGAGGTAVPVVTLNS